MMAVGEMREPRQKRVQHGTYLSISFVDIELCVRRGVSLLEFIFLFISDAFLVFVPYIFFPLNNVGLINKMYKISSNKHIDSLNASFTFASYRVGTLL